MAYPPPPLPRQTVSVAQFSMVLGLAGLGYALQKAAALWGFSPLFGVAQLALAFAVWLLLVGRCLLQYWRDPRPLQEEFNDPLRASAAALAGIATLVFVPAAAPHSLLLAGALTLLGIGWQLGFSTWHAARLWQGGRQPAHTTPALFLPDVAGNFSCAAALGALGQPEWAWLFLGAGLFSWLSVEAVIKTGVFHQAALPPERRALLGIQAAPPVVCASALLAIAPAVEPTIILLLLGYGLYQLLQGLRLLPWLKVQPLGRPHWALTFGLTSALNCCLYLAQQGNRAALAMAAPLMLAVGGFVLCLGARSCLREAPR